MKRIGQGIEKFRRETYGEMSELFRELADKQSPETLFITCSDSRIDPNLITQTGPGELFICRTVGNLIPPHSEQVGAVASSIEYAVGALHVRNIVVCGHSNCGAMNALLHPAKLESLPSTRAWLKYAQPALRALDADGQSRLSSDDTRLRNVTEHNVVCQIENLKTHPVVAAGLDRGDLDIYGFVYNIGNGIVHSYDASSKSFLPVEGGVLACATPGGNLNGASHNRAVQGAA